MKTFIMDIIDPYLTKINDHKIRQNKQLEKTEGKKEQF